MTSSPAIAAIWLGHEAASLGLGRLCACGDRQCCGLRQRARCRLRARARSRVRARRQDRERGSKRRSLRRSRAALHAAMSRSTKRDERQHQAVVGERVGLAQSRPGAPPRKSSSRSRSVTTPIASAATGGPLPCVSAQETMPPDGELRRARLVPRAPRPDTDERTAASPSIARSSRCRNAPERRRCPQRCGSLDESTRPLRSTMRKPPRPASTATTADGAASSSASAVHWPGAARRAVSGREPRGRATTSGSGDARASVACSPTQTSSPLTTVPSSASRLVTRASARCESRTPCTPSNQAQSAGRPAERGGVAPRLGLDQVRDECSESRWRALRDRRRRCRESERVAADFRRWTGLAFHIGVAADVSRRRHYKALRPRSLASLCK